ncbi:hypothetical protein [Microbacterium sp. G2-8]|uniref:hypothetical protein n=1 Tax=Microbacterium sp. G2-8 TaxID=2842454 RepID=UPI001C89AC25|nr:hypothetical protein [Microbacterium sp. G2-8]
MTTTESHVAQLARFDRTTAFWGPATMGAAALISLAAAAYLLFGTGLGITVSDVAIAAGAVLGTFAIIALVEPIAYFPTLGRSAMYQAFMIGNISNKLLPAAVIAQARLDARPGTRRAELVAGSAIVGAVLVHLTSLVLFVGLLGTWLVSQLPAGVIAVTQTYILPAVLGAVLLQVIVSARSARITVIALAVAAVMNFVLVPLIPPLGYASTAIAVISTVILAWVLRRRTDPSTTPTEPEGDAR